MKYCGRRALETVNALGGGQLLGEFAERVSEYGLL
jgi:hypothetical protein